MKSVLVYTVHKAASMFLYELGSEITRRLKMEYFSINNHDQTSLIREMSWKKFMEGKNGCFCPIRSGAAEPSIPDDLSSYSIVLHLRDPRDVLTSLFYSYAYSHPKEPGKFDPSDEQRIKWREKGIDSFVIGNIPVFMERYEKLISALLGKSNVIFLKYETMVTDYSVWLNHFLSAFFTDRPLNNQTTEDPSSGPSFNRICNKLFALHKDDFIVKSENILGHKRQIIPGDYERKLTPKTISLLNEKFKDILEKLCYPIHENSLT